MSDGIAVVSGGMDSVVMLYKLTSEGKHPNVVSFNYGQKHFKEIQFARDHASRLGLTHDTIPMEWYGELLWDMGSESSLVTDVDVPEGHYAEDNMKNTNVPNRNSIMLNIAAGFCVACKGSYVATGVHAGDHFQYPDCRPQFIFDTEKALRTANEGFLPPTFEVLAPWLHVPKHHILGQAWELSASDEIAFESILGNSWSCYKGEALHCGRCGTCVERAEAFYLADLPDPTQYESPEYWKSVSKVYLKEKA